MIPTASKFSTSQFTTFRPYELAFDIVPAAPGPLPPVDELINLILAAKDESPLQFILPGDVETRRPNVQVLMYPRRVRVWTAVPEHLTAEELMGGIQRLLLEHGLRVAGMEVRL